jgi:hypothetical protein
MSLIKSPSYIDSEKLSEVTKAGVRIISEMSTPRILVFVAVRHRVGLLSFSTFLLGSYIAYDKFLHIFI